MCQERFVRTSSSERAWVKFSQWGYMYSSQTVTVHCVSQTKNRSECVSVTQCCLPTTTTKTAEEVGICAPTQNRNTEFRWHARARKRNYLFQIMSMRKFWVLSEPRQQWGSEWWIDSWTACEWKLVQHANTYQMTSPRCANPYSKAGKDDSCLSFSVFWPIFTKYLSFWIIPSVNCLIHQEIVLCQLHYGV